MWEMAAHEHGISSLAIAQSSAHERVLVLSADESEAKMWEMDLSHEGGLSKCQKRPNITSKEAY
jgi:hypothetical protein